MASTNLNLSVVNVKSPVIKVIVNVVATIPELIKNREGAVGTLLQGLAGQPSGGLADELSKSPINSIMARGNAGSGKVILEQATIQSAAFLADAKGAITIAPVLTNSAINIPVSVSLSQSVAKRLNLVPAGTPTNSPYVKLPDFVAETGTFGDPKAQINKLALLALAAKGAGIGGTAGSIIQGLGNPGGGGTNASSTNKVNNLLQGLGGILGGSAAGTNAPSNQPSTNQAPLNNLLNDLLNQQKKKK
jgi:hypothetical protein